MVNRNGKRTAPLASSRSEQVPPLMKRVLLIEDEAADAVWIEQAFKRFSLDVQLEQASSAEFGWELMKCWADAPAARRPVCVLIGLTPGARDGIWLLEQMQADRRFRNLPVITFGRGAGMSDRARLYSNVVGALERPVDDVVWRQTIGAIARLSHALPDLARG
tara:strand:- start:9078 stop:9566 length:489 start_codon:yes stop_codon:yes gene_type:complete